VTRSSWETVVLDALALYRWRVAHFRPARMADGSWRTPVAAQGKGFPDLVIVRDQSLGFVELKSDADRLRPEQLDWQLALASVSAVSAHVLVEVWRPSNFDRVMQLIRDGWA
jgi:hypothetical protein